MMLYVALHFGDNKSSLFTMCDLVARQWERDTLILVIQRSAVRLEEELQLER